MDRVIVSETPELWVRHPAGGTQCPGCHHPLVEKLLAEVVHEMGLAGDAVVLIGVGCYTRAVAVLDVDCMQCAHGRACDVATGIKRMRKDNVVITMQGDGDAAAIGAEGLLSAAARAENFTVLMLNNANYGATGGQIAPTTLMGQVTPTSPEGRDRSHGYPLHVAELLANIRGVAYSARTTVHTPPNYQRTKRLLRKAIEKQQQGLGLSFLEIVVACPTDWHLTPIESLAFIEEQMLREFPLGEFKNIDRIE